MFSKILKTNIKRSIIRVSGSRKIYKCPTHSEFNFYLWHWRNKVNVWSSRRICIKSLPFTSWSCCNWVNLVYFWCNHCHCVCILSIYVIIIGWYSRNNNRNNWYRSVSTNYASSDKPIISKKGANFNINVFISFIFREGKLIIKGLAVPVYLTVNDPESFSFSIFSQKDYNFI